MNNFFDTSGAPRNEAELADRIAAYLAANPVDQGAPGAQTERPGFLSRLGTSAGRAAMDGTILGQAYQQWLRGQGYDPAALATRVPERFAASPFMAEDYRLKTEDRGVQPLPGGQLARRPIDAMSPLERDRYASDWERLDAPQQAAYEAMSAPARAAYADWRADFERNNALPPAETTAEHAADLLGALIASAASPEGLVGFVPPAANGLAIVKQVPALARETAQTMDAVVRSFRNRLGRNPTEAELRAAMPNFSQRTASWKFGDKGTMKGRPIDDVVQDLLDGRLAPSDLPLQVITRDGKAVSLNTRSLIALQKAGIDPRTFALDDLTGIGGYERDLTRRLARNRLGPTGTDVIPRISDRNPGQ